MTNCRCRPRTGIAALSALLLLLAAGLTACGQDEERSGRPNARPAAKLLQSADRLRPPMPKVLDTTRVDIARLDPDLRSALADAVRAARADGVRIEVTSGWRSREHQQRLLDEAVLKYGSLAKALEYVASPDDSAHVTGDAVDIGPTEAAVWLGRHGSAYGLCQIFANEIWHFELATESGGECPPMYADGASR